MLGRSITPPKRVLSKTGGHSVSGEKKTVFETLFQYWTLLETYAHYKPSVNHTFLAGVDIRHYSIVDKQAIPANSNIDINYQQAIERWLDYKIDK